MQVNQPISGTDKANTNTRPITLRMLQGRLATIKGLIKEGDDLVLTASINGRVTALHTNNFEVDDAGELEFFFIDEEPAPQSKTDWTHEKPTQPGAYYVKGFRLGEDGDRPALVDVVLNENSELICNIHLSNSEDNLRQWSFVQDCADRFEWLRPLTAQTAQQTEQELGFNQVVGRVHHNSDHPEPIRAVLNSVGRMLDDNAPLYAEPPTVAGLVEALETSFPLLKESGLNPVKYHCEYAIQQDRKRLHAILAAHRAKGGVQ